MPGKPIAPGFAYYRLKVILTSHITDTMQRQAAVRIDRKSAAQTPKCRRSNNRQERYTTIEFKPYTLKIRKPGTVINDHLYGEGQYTLTNAYGKRKRHNIYAKTREECEEKLAEMIAEVKAQIKTEKEKMTG